MEYWYDWPMQCRYLSGDKYKEGIVFITVKGAGHMVPQDKRASAFKIFDSFMNGKLPCEE